MILIFIKSPFNHSDAKLDFFTRLGSLTLRCRLHPGGQCRNQALRTLGQYTRTPCQVRPSPIALPGWCLFTLPHAVQDLPPTGGRPWWRELSHHPKTSVRPSLVSISGVDFLPSQAGHAGCRESTSLLPLHPWAPPGQSFLCSSRACPIVWQGSLAHLLDIS